MSREFIDRCNVCGATRGPGNHWNLMIRPAAGSPYLTEWDDDEAAYSQMCCSAACAHKALDEWFSARQAERLAAKRAEENDSEPIDIESPSVST